MKNFYKVAALSVLALSHVGCGDTTGAGVSGREFQLANSAITELSGIAPSTLVPGLFWALNDSGDQPRVFAFDGQGNNMAEALILPAVNADWEDMASYKTASGSYLLIADVGDNEAIRPFVNLYLVREPAQLPVQRPLFVEASLSVLYPDGSRDCEGVAVDAEAGYIYLLSKRDPLPRLYRLPLSSVPGLPITAEFVGEISSLPLPSSGQLEPFGSITNVSPTAFAISADGRSALIVTLENSYRYTRLGGQTWLQALNGVPEVFAVPDYSQIEAGDFIAGQVDFLIGSEGAPARVWSSVSLSASAGSSTNAED